MRTNEDIQLDYNEVNFINDNEENKENMSIAKVIENNGMYYKGFLLIIDFSNLYCGSSIINTFPLILFYNSLYIYRFLLDLSLVPNNRRRG